jgi:hypothetical protein
MPGWLAGAMIDDEPISSLLASKAFSPVVISVGTEATTLGCGAGF